MTADAAAETCDTLLGGRVRLWQPARGYRAGADAALLAAACPARPGERALDLGCGVGAAALCLAARVTGLELHGLERDPAAAELARRNAALNGASLTVHEGDVAAPPAALKALAFDHALCNPPYFPAVSPPSPEPARDAARREGPQGVALWVDAALRRLRQGGRLTMIHRVEALPELLAALAGRAGSVAVLPLAAREGRAAARMILAARKDRRGPFRIAPALALHAGPVHADGPERWTEAARAILRDAAPLDF